MPSKLTLIVAAAVAAVGLAATPMLQAHDRQGSPGSMMRPGTMGQEGMMGGMMNMMSQMGETMQGCSQMMQGMMGGDGSGRPNEQWRKNAPAKPGKSG